ncbi:Cysteine-rich motor neuron 1 protein, partial [Stegodyphus mimosarum]
MQALLLLIFSNIVSLLESAKADVQKGIIERKRRSFVSELPLHCPPCEQVHCDNYVRCKGGFSFDVCNCCKVCAKLEGEQCGGHHNYLGRCDKGLTCQPREPAEVTFFKDGVKKVYRVERGLCKKVSSCKPKCDPVYCSKSPTAICSAVGNSDKMQQCQGVCQHTSCRACKFIMLPQVCPKCSSYDFRCIRRFGKCTQKNESK